MTKTIAACENGLQVQGEIRETVFLARRHVPKLFEKSFTRNLYAFISPSGVDQGQPFGN
ncbi:hypothetical protein [Komagataeibacter intermedius]|uniref:hypothetical protein n=1 Tax=Komagataeibacter intermedius TaxID=66229 RepID=UPI00131F45F4|nr:hypothetical protein [Komagataeibacter intermedius]